MITNMKIQYSLPDPVFNDLANPDGPLNANCSILLCTSTQSLPSTKIFLLEEVCLSFAIFSVKRNSILNTFTHLKHAFLGLFGLT